MMQFSKDPRVAEQQMQAIIVYLTTFGYIDGNFDLSEKIFILEYIRKLVEVRVDEQAIKDAALRLEVIEKQTTHYDEFFEAVDNQIRRLFEEVAPSIETLETFVYSKLKLSCFEIFKSFDNDNQKAMLAVVDGLISADGVVHPAEEKFRAELTSLLDAEAPLPPPPPEPARRRTGTLVMTAVTIPDEVLQSPPLAVSPAEHRPLATTNHPLLQSIEQHYSRNPQVLSQQAGGDYDLIVKTMTAWNTQREAGNGMLNGKITVDDLAGTPAFLDGYTYSLMPERGKEYELTVLGDLHGCYSCFKGALLQADFFRKVASYRKDPINNPNPKLVLLGDYVDRGMFSFNGILRTAMQLFTTMPEHVFILRGNHEYYVERFGTIDSGVRPAEGIATLAPFFPRQMFEAFMALFDAMPHALLFERILFAHAGIPRDDTQAERWVDLSSMNDAQVRFQMLWSDPSVANFVPAELQRENARFPFGKQQFRTFMQKLGTHTMIRGHEKVDEGMKKIYNEADMTLINLFSAGGRDNNDLPPNASYRSVTPMALTIRYKDGPISAIPWKIDWASFNNPERNGFYRTPAEIEFRSI